MRVELDRKALFALASDSRLEILKAMQPMRRTVTQLAECLGIDKAAVYRHLKTLEEGGFVKRYEDHGFVYYGLSWKARDLLAPSESTRVVVILASALVMAGFVVFLSMFVLITPDDAVRMLPGSDGPPQDGYTQWGPEYVFGSLAVFWAVFIVSAAALVGLSIAAIRTVRRPKQPGARRESEALRDPDCAPGAENDTSISEGPCDDRCASGPRS